MNKIIITTDSTADLPKEILDSMQIKTIPLYVRFNEDVYKDGVDLTTEMLYKKVDELGYLPQTQAASPGDFVEFFEPFIKDGYDVIYIGIGSTISGTLKSAMIAKDMLETDKIHIIDSLNLSSGIGLLVLHAAKLRDEGLDVKQIIEKITSYVPMVRSQFAIKTMDYLHKGGRATGLQAFMGSILKLKIIIKVEDGKLGVYKKTVGKMSKALDVMIDDLKAMIDRVDKEFLFITHSLADSSYEYIYEQIKDLGFKHIINGHAGCVISSHCGEGTIGILYIENKN